jgi:hypothetical protein
MINSNTSESIDVTADKLIEYNQVKYSLIENFPVDM